MPNPHKDTIVSIASSLEVQADALERQAAILRSQASLLYKETKEMADA